MQSMEKLLLGIATWLTLIISSPTAIIAEGRPIKKFYKNEESLPSPLDRAYCENTVYRIAESYGNNELEDYLASDFPNADEVIDTLNRVAFKVTDIELSIQAIQSIHTTPWTETKLRDGTTHLQSQCIVDLRTRLSFDDQTTGKRIIRSVGQTKWHFKLIANTTESHTEGNMVSTLSFAQPANLEGALFIRGVIEQILFDSSTAN